MNEDKTYWKGRICTALNAMLTRGGLSAAVEADAVIAETPPKPELGDLSFPMFPFAKLFKKAPAQIAAQAAEELRAEPGNPQPAISADGPYINIKLDRAQKLYSTLKLALDGESEFYKIKSLAGKRVMVEFSSPNTNKPLHLGHLRNDALGESVSRILAACGAEVKKVCIINDRGIHICKSMLAYKECFASDYPAPPVPTPEELGMKSDNFVGSCYVKFNEMEKRDGAALGRAQELLHKWEAGDADTLALWRLMNEWALSGIKQTYKRTGVSFDKYYFESDTYLAGKKEVLKGLERGIFIREADGSVQADLTAEGLDKKVLLRADGTSLYITQDFGTAVRRHEDWAFDKLIYVVGSEQKYHFRVLFLLLKKMGFAWADDLYHLSYGMVNLPEGKMKSREGTVVDADALLDSLRDMALAEIKAREREAAVGNAEETAERVAIGALHYYLLQVTPEHDMLFNPRESLQFNGNTGPYLQYMGARICSILRGAGERGAAALCQTTISDFNDKISNRNPCSLFPVPCSLVSDDEWELIKSIAVYPDTVKQSAESMNPAVLTAYLYELSKNFSRFYHNCPVLNAGNETLTERRLALCRACLNVFKSAFNLVCIPFLDAM